jgi:hypothetical protein
MTFPAEETFVVEAMKEENNLEGKNETSLDKAGVCMTELPTNGTPEV